MFLQAKHRSSHDNSKHSRTKATYLNQSPPTIKTCRVFRPLLMRFRTGSSPVPCLCVAELYVALVLQALEQALNPLTITLNSKRRLSVSVNARL